jgi:hypothetical protein
MSLGGDHQVREENAAARTPFLRRMHRAAMLRADLYEEVEADRSSLHQALAVVGLASLAGALGTWLRVAMGHPLPASALPLPLHLALIAAEPITVWLVSSAFAYMVGATFLRGPHTQTDYAEVLRTTGFAFAPGLLLFFVWVPPEEVGLVAWTVGRAWILVAAVVAVRQALDFSTLRALATFGASALLMWLVLWGLSVAPVPL